MLILVLKAAESVENERIDTIYSGHSFFPQACEYEATSTRLPVSRSRVKLLLSSTSTVLTPDLLHYHTVVVSSFPAPQLGMSPTYLLSCTHD